jgi:hypothetical protein
LKPTSTVSPADITDAKPNWEKATGTPAWEQTEQPEKKVVADVQGTKLQAMLRHLKK